jgi:hypothetical protein
MNFFVDVGEFGRIRVSALPGQTVIDVKNRVEMAMGIPVRIPLIDRY